MTKIFIAAAHKENSPLLKLVEEVRFIIESINKLNSKEGGNEIQLIDNRVANLEDIFNTFTEQKDIKIFHYAGHADEENLYLEEAGNIKGIAKLFGLNVNSSSSWNPLSLVFLNGCATKGQVAHLHQSRIPAIIATSRPVDDSLAMLFAKQFYAQWVKEEKTLLQAFEEAKALIQMKAKDLDIVTTDRHMKISDKDEFHHSVDWGLYIHPELENPDEIFNWVLNNRVKQPSMFVKPDVKPIPNARLRKLVVEFINSDKDAKEVVLRQKKEPLLVLIERLPWIVAKHLRRLFADEVDKTMLSLSEERLKELISAYSELCRFIYYICVSMLWDSIRTEKRKGNSKKLPLLTINLFPNRTQLPTFNYLNQSIICLAYLENFQHESTDQVGIRNEIKQFIELIHENDNLNKAFQELEEWKIALMKGERYWEQFILSKTSGEDEKLKKIVLNAEFNYATLLKEALFFTNYKLYTVRNIIVDKIRNLEFEDVYSHHTITLHAAFGSLTKLKIPWKKHTDNYCLLLTPRIHEGESLAVAINLSPFYLDRSSYFGKGLGDNPSLFALEFKEIQGEENRFLFRYIDSDINYKYSFEGDHEFFIDTGGAEFQEGLEIEYETLLLRFRPIYDQFQTLEQDLYS